MSSLKERQVSRLSFPPLLLWGEVWGEEEVKIIASGHEEHSNLNPLCHSRGPFCHSHESGNLSYILIGELNYLAFCFYFLYFFSFFPFSFLTRYSILYTRYCFCTLQPSLYSCPHLFPAPIRSTLYAPR